jgi:WXG100 family type VII secretion target
VTVRYGVDLDELDLTISELTKLQALLERQLTHLDETVEGLHVTWTGAAATAHRAAHVEWTRGAREMHTGLTEMIAAAKLAHGNYHGAATANQTMWGSLG